MVILTNLYRPLKYHREQIKSSKTKYSLESEWKNAEILCNHVSQCPNLLLFRLNSEWGKSWNCGRTGNRNNIRNDAGKEVHDIIGSLSSDVFERRTSTGSEVFSLLTCLDDIKFVFLSFFTVIEAIWLKLCAKPPSKNEKRPLPVDVRRSKTLLLKLPIHRS